MCIKGESTANGRDSSHDNHSFIPRVLNKKKKQHRKKKQKHTQVNISKIKFVDIQRTSRGIDINLYQNTHTHTTLCKAFYTNHFDNIFFPTKYTKIYRKYCLFVCIVATAGYKKYAFVFVNFHKRGALGVYTAMAVVVEVREHEDETTIQFSFYYTLPWVKSVRMVMTHQITSISVRT